MSKEELQALYDRFGTVQKVAKFLGKPRSTVKGMLDRNGVVLHASGVHVVESKVLKAVGGIARLRQRYEEVGAAALADSLNTSTGSLFYLLKKFAIPRKFVAEDGRAWNKGLKYTSEQKGWLWTSESRKVFSAQKKALYATGYRIKNLNSNKGRTWDEIFGEEKAEVMRLKLISRMKSGVNKNTSIELALQDALKAEGVNFKTHFRINLDGRRFTLPDIFIEPNICVYADGVYWHTLPKNKEKDDRITSQLENRGYKVLRFWESEINKNLAACVSVVVEAL